MNITPEWLKAMPMSFAGTVYEPWVQLLQFLLVASVLLSFIAWVLTRRHVIAVARQIWALAIRAHEAMNQATRYPPAVERRLKRLDPYMDLVFLAPLGTLEVCLLAFAMVSFTCAVFLGMWWEAALSLPFGAWFGCLGRLHWAKASWAWHRIKTGKEITWPPRRAS
jgi:hypothetical protein